MPPERLRGRLDPLLVQHPSAAIHKNVPLRLLKPSSRRFWRNKTARCDENVRIFRCVRSPRAYPTRCGNRESIKSHVGDRCSTISSAPVSNLDKDSRSLDRVNGVEPDVVLYRVPEHPRKGIQGRRRRRDTFLGAR